MLENITSGDRRNGTIVTAVYLLIIWEFTGIGGHEACLPSMMKSKRQYSYMPNSGFFRGGVAFRGGGGNWSIWRICMHNTQGSNAYNMMPKPRAWQVSEARVSNIPDVAKRDTVGEKTVPVSICHEVKTVIPDQNTMRQYLWRGCESEMKNENSCFQKLLDKIQFPHCLTVSHQLWIFEKVTESAQFRLSTEK